MHQLARRVRDLQDALRRMEVVDAPQAPIARRLRVRGRRGDRRRRTERLVIGGYEDGDADLTASPTRRPLAQALMGAEPGDTRVVRVAGRRASSR
jgi:transcription elongation GreA/GreB family factor